MGLSKGAICRRRSHHLIGRPSSRTVELMTKRLYRLSQRVKVNWHSNGDNGNSDNSNISTVEKPGTNDNSNNDNTSDDGSDDSGDSGGNDDNINNDGNIDDLLLEVMTDNEDIGISENDFSDLNETEPISNYSNHSQYVYSGEYGPYFNSFTMAAFSVFLRMTKMSRRHFSTLLRILRHQHFKVADLPQPYADARRAFANIPTLPIHVRHLRVDKKKGSGRSDEKTTPVYTHSLTDILCHVLSTPSLVSHMHFGPGVRVHEPTEFWHGTLWMESPLFGVSEVVVKGQLYLYIFI